MKLFSWLASAGAALALLAGCAASAPAADPAQAQITVLYDAFGKEPALMKDGSGAIATSRRPLRGMHLHSSLGLTAAPAAAPRAPRHAYRRRCA